MTENTASPQPVEAGCNFVRRFTFGHAKSPFEEFQHLGGAHKAAARDLGAFAIQKQQGRNAANAVFLREDLACIVIDIALYDDELFVQRRLDGGVRPNTRVHHAAGATPVCRETKQDDLVLFGGVCKGSGEISAPCRFPFGIRWCGGLGECGGRGSNGGEQGAGKGPGDE